MKNNLIIRHMRASDLASALYLKEAENWNQTEKEWTFFMDQNEKECFVACIDNQVVATVTAITYSDQLAWIGMMLVARECRRQGISKALLHSVLEALSTYPFIGLDATPAGKPVYEKCGFVEEYDIYRMTIAALPKIEESFFGRQENMHMDLSLIAEKDLPEIARIDQGVFGANRLSVLQFLMEQKPDACWQLKQDGQLQGYVFGRTGSNYHQIGPVVAHSTSISKILISKAFRDLEEQSVVVDVVSDKKGLINWLHAWGFVLQRKLTRMYLHSQISAEKRGQQHLICGPEFG